MDPLRFRSRIDGWLAALIAIPLLIALGATAAQAWSHGPGAILAVVAGNGLVLGLVVWIYLDTSYTLTASELVIRCGPMRSTVALSTIQRVRHSHSLLSAPALSLRRLELHGPSGVQAVISPADLEAFLAALKTRVPGVVLP